MILHFKRMQRIGAVVATLVVLGGCAAQQRTAMQAPRAPFVAAGATNVVVEWSGHSAWRIRYHASDTPTSWYTTLAQELEAHGWTSSDQVAYAPLNRSYSRTTSLGMATVWEWAFFSLDPFHPEQVHISVQRTVDVPWWRRWKRLLADATRNLEAVPLVPSGDHPAQLVSRR